MIRIRLLDRHFRSMCFSSLLLFFTFVTVVLVPPAAAQPKDAAPRASATAFKLLWKICTIKGTTAEANSALSNFKTIVAQDEQFSPQLREALTKISLDSDERFSLGLNDNERHPAIGGINFLAIESTFAKGRGTTYGLFGRVSKDIEYGVSQQNYDSYLSEINAHSSLFATVALKNAPSLSIRRLIELQSIFKQMGDVQWELKALRWQLGAFGVDELISPRTADQWIRLGQLETGVVGELDRFLAEASLIARDGTAIQRDPEIVDEKPVAVEKPTTEQCFQAIQLMIDMKMPWEAFLFLEHSKEKWNINPAGSLPKIKESWTRDISGPSSLWEKYYSRPWFISSVKVVPSTTLEEFLKEFETRPNLPK